MKIDILTLFPNMFEGFLNESIIKRAIDKDIVDIDTVNIRDFSLDKNKKVDDTPYGGGAGMILKCQPIFDAVKKLQKKNSKVILMTPQGETFTQKIANNLSKEEHLILICGHYEGFDERIRSICDMEISIGDYVLTGGEIPSMVVTDSVVRLLKGVIEEESHTNDSFQNDLLEHPHYTKPREYADLKVPDVLVSGDHKEISKYRKEESIKRTKERRPELLVNLKYKLFKDKKKKEAVIDKEVLNGYDFSPKNNAKREDVIDVRRMIVVDPLFVEKIAKKNIERKLQKLLKMRLELDSDNESDDATLILGEADRLKKVVYNNYQKILKEEYKDAIQKRIDYIVKDIKIINKKLEEIELPRKSK